MCSQEQKKIKKKCSHQQHTQYVVLSSTAAQRNAAQFIEVCHLHKRRITFMYAQCMHISFLILPSCYSPQVTTRHFITRALDLRGQQLVL